MTATAAPKQKVLLAYSGGLDTSCILAWLIEEGYEVVCYMANIGQEEDFEAARLKALKIGATKVYIEDLRKEFVEDLVWPAVQANLLYEGVYLLGTALARPVIARKQIEIATLENCKYVSHGCTGKGNDQVRFELGYYALSSSIEVIAPWRDPKFFERFPGRPALLEYAAEHDAPNTPERIEVHFAQGKPVKVVNTVDGVVVTEALELFLYLNALGRKHGVGRIDIVENRFIGIKSRGCYETPGGTILRAAHVDLEGLTLDREVRRLKDNYTQRLAEIVYNGLWFSAEREFLMASVEQSQKAVNGIVKVKLYKGNAIIEGRSSTISLYDEKIASMDEAGGFNPSDSEGFIKIQRIRLKAYMAQQALMKKLDL
ncbi:hypothetical protein BASA50_004778 [Batrachochytrium salamandrivorans]|uniref:argininosuccinate synthase n=1 Tax=Batrachochytrium salamandrivorans TaxID=1357716 RepID=A0ABQ8FEQ1_9FUNG|nr:hypothetical protein BASA62_004283 [Batrachochytrium salamandrivorans]KAH6590666.1 hypothetical protein BASA61_005186 [Batrachochytrium salamandrivorans]KAH6597020.1 hypothetical protein BASA50_004778 [Batrachochytrium salamandrivorans]